ncbi:MAG TPA: GTP cyclohydrolase II [Saprospiraceae bacterium]|nr:GTP cyclohydrolase II [Saprospiraceae bacterium]HMP24986.1 GTP cyclohydrolase II [Saprospiraceae bacterium]
MVKSSKRTLQISEQAEALIPTPWGNFRMIAFAENASDWMPHLALVHEHFNPERPALLRIHSECLTGDIFHSKRCDCGEQLDKSLEMTAQAGGLVLYLRQEGRGIGLINKLKAYNLQDLGLNTVDANVHLGLEIDARQYDIAIEMLLTLGIKQVNLLTNNPDKIEALEHSPIEVLSRVPLIIEPRQENSGYLKTKKEEMGHLLEE